MTSKLKPDLVSIEEQKDTNFTLDKVEEKYTSHVALKEWEEEKTQNTLTQNIVALLGIHGMHCQFYENENASHITKAFESLFTQHHQDLMSEVVESKKAIANARETVAELITLMKSVRSIVTEEALRAKIDALELQNSLLNH